jgi:hypothetical protein
MIDSRAMKISQLLAVTLCAFVAVGCHDAPPNVSAKQNDNLVCRYLASELTGSTCDPIYGGVGSDSIYTALAGINGARFYCLIDNRHTVQCAPSAVQLPALKPAPSLPSPTPAPAASP